MKKYKEEFIELEVESIGFEGIAIARKDSQVFFVRGGLPGDIVIAQLKKKHKNYIEASIKNIIKPSGDRIEPFCEYFGACGGCSWQCLTYEKQLEWKKKQVVDAYERIGKIKVGTVHDVLPASRTLRYRNKMDFSFSSSRWLTTAEIETQQEVNKNFALGLHIPGRYDKVLDINSCKIQNPMWDEVLNSIRNKSIEFNISAFSTYRHTGFLKGLCLRYSALNDETLSILITTQPQTECENNFLDWYKYNLQTQFPKITSVVHAINITNSVNTGDINFIVGKDSLVENILDIKYQISPFSFFQTNSFQLDSFINKIITSANLNKNHIAWDLYCGTGSITLPASKLCKNIYGVELSDSSIKDAKNNAKNNNIDNAIFHAADLHQKQIPELLLTLPKPDVIIIDPPRSGMHPNLINHLLDVAASKIIYVSCNPATQARDLSVLSNKYNITDAFPVDMFPHTYHIEVITILETIS